MHDKSIQYALLLANKSQVSCSEQSHANSLTCLAQKGCTVIKARVTLLWSQHIHFARMNTPIKDFSALPVKFLFYFVLQTLQSTTTAAIVIVSVKPRKVIKSPDEYSTFDKWNAPAVQKLSSGFPPDSLKNPKTSNTEFHSTKHNQTYKPHGKRPYSGMLMSFAVGDVTTQ